MGSLDITATGNSLQGVTIVSDTMDTLFLDMRENNWGLFYLLRDAAREGARVIVTCKDTEFTPNLLLASSLFADTAFAEDLEVDRFEILSHHQIRTQGISAKMVFDIKDVHYMDCERHIRDVPKNAAIDPQAYDRTRGQLGLKPYQPAVFIPFPEPPTPP